MMRGLAALVALLGVAVHRPPVPVAASEPVVEIAVVANAEAAQVTFVDVQARAIVGVIDVNPARRRRPRGPASRTSPRTPTCPRMAVRSTCRAAISATSQRSTSRPAGCSGSDR